MKMMYPHPHPFHILILNILNILEKRIILCFLHIHNLQLQLELGRMPLLPWVWRLSVQETECLETECPGTECPGDSLPGRLSGWGG